MKHILAAGDSYTDDNFKPKFDPTYDVSYDKWPTILGEKLELPVKNIAKCGASNDDIHDKVVNYISKNYKDIELVVIGWTEYYRFHNWNYFHHNPVSTLLDFGNKDKSNRANVWDYHRCTLDFYKFLFNEKLFKSNYKNSIVKFASEKHFNEMITIQNLCEAFGIKLIMSSLCGCYNKNYPQLAKDLGHNKTPVNNDYIAMAVMSTENFLDVNEKNIIGWPFVKSLGGFEINCNIMKEEHKIGNGDGHPNKLGHKMIAEMYYEKYKEIYL